MKTGEKVELSGLTDKTRQLEVMGLEMFHKTLDTGMAGDQCGRNFREVGVFKILDCMGMVGGIV